MARRILDAAMAEDAGMIRVGSRGLGRVCESLPGSVSQGVLHLATCQVVFAK